MLANGRLLSCPTSVAKVILFPRPPLSITDSIPEDLRDPFYTDQYDQEHIKPPVIRLMLSGELYCRVYSLILKTEQAASLQSHLSVIQALSRKGIYVVESDGTPVTDEDLSSMPIKMVRKRVKDDRFLLVGEATAQLSCAASSLIKAVASASTSRLGVNVA